MAYIEPVNPFTQEKIGKFELESFEIQKEKVSALNQTQKNWKKESLEKRLELVKAALSYFETNRIEIAKDISEQIGRHKRWPAGQR